jgi:hypothetical protein
MVEGGGFEPPKAEPSDLQSDPFGRSGTPPINHACANHAHAALAHILPCTESGEFCGNMASLSTDVIDFR